jgi:hypothetical protein
MAALRDEMGAHELEDQPNQQALERLRRLLARYEDRAQAEGPIAPEDGSIGPPPPVQEVLPVRRDVPSNASSLTSSVDRGVLAAPGGGASAASPDGPFARGAPGDGGGGSSSSGGESAAATG